MNSKHITNLGSSRLRHVDRVDSIRASKNGSLLVSASWDYSVVLWDAISGEKLKSFIGHSGYIRFADFIFNDTGVLSCSEDGTLKFWSLTDESENWTIRVSNSAISNFDIYENYGFVCCLDNNIYKVNLKSAQLENFYLSHQKSKVEFGISIDHRWLIKELDNNAYAIFETDFPDNIYAVITNSDIHGNINDKFYAKFKNKKSWFQSLSKEIFVVKYNSKNDSIFSSGRDLGVRIWDCSAQYCLKHFGVEHGIIRYLVLDELNQQVLLVNEIGQLIIYTTDGQLIKVITVSNKLLLHVAITDIGLVAVGEDTKVYLIDKQGNIDILSGHFWHITSAYWISEKKQLVTASKDYTIRLWDIYNKKEITPYNDAPIDYIDTVVFTIIDNNLSIIGGSEDGTVRLWYLDNSNILIKKMPGQVYCINKTFDDKYIIIGDNRGNLSVFNMLEKKEIKFIDSNCIEAGWLYLTIEQLGSQICCFGINSNGEFIKIIVSLNSNLIVRDIIYNKLGRLKCANFCIKSKTLACGNFDGETIIYQYSEKNNTLECINSDNLHNEEWITALTQSISLNCVVTGSWNRSIIYRNENKDIIELTGHYDTIRSLIFSNDEKFLISSGWDQTIRIWSTETFEQILCIRNSGRGVCLDSIFYNNSLYLAAGNVNTTISIFKIDNI